jgi:sugar lactone lactonase YvrE
LAFILERALYLIFVLIVAVLGALGWSLYRWEHVYGPTYAAAFDDGRVMVASGAAFYDLDASGKLLRQFKLRAVGLGPIVTDFQALKDGTALVGDSKAGAIMKCDFHAYRCAPLYGPKGDAGRLAPAFKLAVDEARGRIYVSDTQHHRLLVLALDGRLLGSSEGTGLKLSFPNELILLDPKRLAVADTGNGRIAVVDVSGEGFRPALLAEIHAHTVVDGVAMDPIAVRVDKEGRLWMVLANNELETGVIAIHGKDGERAALLTMEVEAPDPLSLVMLDDRVLVLDPSGVAIDVIGAGDRDVGSFGDAAFEAALDATAWQRWIYGMIRSYSSTALLSLLIVGIVIHLVDRRRKMGGGPRNARSPT